MYYTCMSLRVVYTQIGSQITVCCQSCRWLRLLFLLGLRLRLAKRLCLWWWGWGTLSLACIAFLMAVTSFCTRTANKAVSSCRILFSVCSRATGAGGATTWLRVLQLRLTLSSVAGVWSWGGIVGYSKIQLGNMRICRDVLRDLAFLALGCLIVLFNNQATQTTEY